MIFAPPIWAAGWASRVVRRLIEQGADGGKVMVYYDPDDTAAVNEQKHVLIERIGDDIKGVVVGKIRQRIGDEAAAPRYLRTEPGIGYRFLGEASPGTGRNS